MRSIQVANITLSKIEEASKILFCVFESSSGFNILQGCHSKKLPEFCLTNQEINKTVKIFLLFKIFGKEFPKKRYCVVTNRIPYVSYSLPYNLTPPISRLRIGPHIFFCLLTSPTCCSSCRKYAPVKHKARPKAGFPIVIRQPRINIDFI